MITYRPHELAGLRDERTILRGLVVDLVSDLAIQPVPDLERVAAHVREMARLLRVG